MPTLAPLKGEVFIDFTEVVAAEGAVKSLGTTMQTELAGSRTKAALSEVGAAVGNVGTTFSNIGARVRTAMSGVGEAVGGAMSAVGSGVSAIGSGLAAAAAKLEAFKNTAKTIGLVSLGVAAGLGFAGFKAISLASDMEQTRIAFTTMLGSAQQADSFIKQLLDFAAHTPFEFQNLKETAQQFLAFGFNANQVIPIMTAVGDAVSGLGGGQEKIDRVTLALGQMQAKGKVSAQEMMQLGEAGIPAWQFLAKAIGTDIPTAMKKAEMNQVSAATGIDAIVTGMESKFGGLMKAQSTTVAGIWSNVMDNLSMTAETVGERLTKSFDLKNRLVGLMNFLGDVRTAVTTGDWGVMDRELGPGKVEGFTAAWAKFSDAIGKLGAVFSRAFGSMQKFLEPFAQWEERLLGSNMDVVLVAIATVIGGVLVAAFAALAVAIWTAMAPILPFILIATGLAVVAYLIYKNWEQISGFFVGLWNTVTGAFMGAWNTISSAVTGFVQSHRVLVAALVLMMGPIAVVIGGIVLLAMNWNRLATAARNVAGVFVTFWQALQSGTDPLHAVGNAIGSLIYFLGGGLDRAIAFESAVDSLADFLGRVAANLVGEFTAAVAVVVGAFQAVTNVVNAVVNVVNTIFLTAFAIWLGVWVLFWRGLSIMLGPPLAAVAGVLGGWMTGVFAMFVAGWNTVTGFLVGTWNAIAEIAAAAWSRVSSIVLGFLNLEVQGIQIIWSFVSGWLSAIWSGIAGVAGYWWNVISGLIGAVVRSDLQVITGVWDAISSFLGGIWSGLYGSSNYWWGQISGTVLGWAGGIRDALAGIWNQVASAATGAATAIWSGIKGGLNAAIRLADTFIKASNDAFGFLGFKVNEIPQLAAGGKTNGPVAIVGEGRAPEYVIPTDSQYRSNAVGLWLAAGKDIGMMAAGGVIGTLTAPISNAINASIGSTSGWVRTLVENLGRFLIDKIGDWVGSHLGALSSAGGGGATAGGALGQWIQAAMALAGVPSSWAGPLNTLIMRESGGNPRAINLWDINAQRGDPSRGLMQTIGATFNAYRLPSLSADIFDPIANIVAGIRYILARYGSIFNVQQAVGAVPQGYAAGGILGKLRLFDQGGNWYSGQLGANLSGRTETVFSGGQMDEMIDHLRAIRQGGLAKVEQHFHGGQVDSQEMFRRADWFARTGSF